MTLVVIVGLKIILYVINTIMRIDSDYVILNEEIYVLSTNQDLYL